MSRKTSAVTGGQTGTKEQYNNLRDEAEASSRLLARAQDTPNLTLAVSEGAVYFGATRVEYAGGNSGSFVAPVSNPRIDCLSINSSGSLVITQGVEGASPAEPACPSGDLPICLIYNRVGETSIKNTSDGTNGYIYKDTRVFVLKVATINSSAGAGDAGKIPALDSSGLLSRTFLNGVKIETFLNSGTFTKEAGAKLVRIQAWGGGGSGGSGTDGGGGGGGAYVDKILDIALFGANETVTIGNGGTAVTGTTGNAGGNTTIGSILTAYGGGAGNLHGGGGGGGENSAGSNGSTTLGGNGGDPFPGLNVTSGDGLSSLFGGGGGGDSTKKGGASYFGGGGGAGGGNANGGASQYGGGGGGGGAMTVGIGGVSKYGGSGGNGGYGGTSAQAGAVPGGGGGGRDSGSGAGASGAGGKGKVIITTFF